MRRTLRRWGSNLTPFDTTSRTPRGQSDAAYIQRTIRIQRALDVAGRLIIGCSRSRAGWALGTATLAYAKSIENMEISHNLLHGQWDWMNDPESTRARGSGTWSGCPRSGGIRTTIATTYSTTFSAWTTTSAST